MGKQIVSLFIVGAYGGWQVPPEQQKDPSQIWLLISCLSLEFLFLSVYRPYLDFLMQLVETLSVLCELGTLYCASLLLHKPPGAASREVIGRSMIFLMFGVVLMQTILTWKLLYEAMKSRKQALGQATSMRRRALTHNFKSMKSFMFERLPS